MIESKAFRWLFFSTNPIVSLVSGIVFGVVLLALPIGIFWTLGPNPRSMIAVAAAVVGVVWIIAIILLFDALGRENVETNNND